MSITVHKLRVSNKTTEQDVDRFFMDMFRPKQQVILHMDLSRCSMGLGKMLKIKGVLNKHRQSSRQYLQCTKIITPGPVMRTVVGAALLLVKPERPVRVTSI